MKQKGLTFQGKPCKYGHSGIRYVRGRICVECSKAYQKQHADSHRQYAREYAKQLRKDGTNPRVSYKSAIHIAFEESLTSKSHQKLISKIFGFSLEKIREDLNKLSQDIKMHKDWLEALQKT